MPTVAVTINLLVINTPMSIVSAMLPLWTVCPVQYTVAIITQQLSSVVQWRVYVAKAPVTPLLSLSIK